MKFNSDFLKYFFPAVILFVSISQSVYSQTVIACNIDGDEFNGKVEDAVQVSMGKDNFIQIKSTNNDKIMYLYIKVSKLNGQMPVTLKNKNHDDEKGEMPDAEIIWVPDGPDKPQWNTVDGSLVVNQYDPEGKTISGTFEFKVEKFEYSSKVKDDRPSLNVKDGKFAALQYKIEGK